MFQQWKCSVTAPIGMFEAWSLDRMIKEHRGRMNTFFREGKIPEDAKLPQPEEHTEKSPGCELIYNREESASNNPYLSGELGGPERKATEIEKTIAQDIEKASTAHKLVKPEPPAVAKKEYASNKMYYSYLMDNGGIEQHQTPGIFVDNGDPSRGLFENWRQGQEPGMFSEWRGGKFAKQEQNEEFLRTKAAREASAARVESMTYEQAKEAALRGDVGASRKIHKREVRLFLLSSFTDTKAERHRLARDVFPYIRDRCSHSAVSFLPVDLGWGQADSALVDTDFANAFLAEMERTSAGCLPGSIGILGFVTDKYGTAVLPEFVRKDEFERLLKGIDDGDECRLVRRWYRLDENAVPPSYRLRKAGTGPTRIAPDKHERRSMSARWTTTESYLMKILKEAVKNTNCLTTEQLQKWTTSPVHRLINRGVFQSAEKVKRSLFIIRDIAQAQRPFSIPTDSFNRKVLDQYVDMHSERDVPDPGSRSSLKEIREGMKANKVKSKKYLINWSPFGVTENTHADYIEHVVSTVGKQLVGRTNLLLSDTPPPDDLLEEVASHSRFCLEQASRFCAREELVTRLLEEGIPRGQRRSILLLHGVRGVGKTATMAKCGSLMRNLFIEEKGCAGPVVVLRFCGLSKNMTTVSLLRSVCRQIKRAFADDSGLVLDKPNDIKSLTNVFQELLHRATQERPLVIMLDSLDDVLNGIQDVDWLPKELPCNVYILLSAFTDSEVCKALMTKANVMAEVKTLNMNDAGAILTQQFQNMGRTLNKSQRDYILAGAVGNLEETPTALRLQLLFEVCKNWASYDPITVFLHRVPSLYANILEKLELDHGKTFVAHVLSLIYVSHGGFSEAELVDILSGDEEVLNSVLLLNTPPVKRFPQASLSRLLQDLSQHMSEVYAYGRNVLVFTNRQLEDAIQLRYIGGTLYMAEKYCNIIVAYYKGEMHDQFPGRNLAPQPLYWQNPDHDIVHFNRAKLAELPMASIRGTYTDKVEESLCDLTFVASKIAAGMLHELLIDYKTAEEELQPDERIAAYRQFITEQGLEIFRDPGQIATLALAMPKDNFVHIHAKAKLDRGEDITTWLPAQGGYSDTLAPSTIITPRVVDMNSPRKRLASMM